MDTPLPVGGSEQVGRAPLPTRGVPQPPFRTRGGLVCVCQVRVYA